MKFLRKFFGAKRINGRLATDSMVCGFHLREYDEKSGQKEYGNCNVYRMVNISNAGIAIEGSELIKKGDFFEFRTKHCIKDDSCFSCVHFSKVEERLPIEPFVGKVIWHNNIIAGINIAKLKDKDKNYIEKIIKSGKL